MGQKVNPIGFRLGITTTWDSRWCDDNKASYVVKLHQDIAIRKYLKRAFHNASIGKIVVARKVDLISVTVHSARPGVVIGKKGGDLERVRQSLSNIVGSKIEFNVSEIKKPEMSAVLMAENVAHQLSKRVSFRRAMKKVVQGCMRAGAKGVKVSCAGRLAGAEIARTEWYNDGRVPLHTLRANIDYGVAEAKTSYGMIGVKVWIYIGDVSISGSLGILE